MLWLAISNAERKYKHLLGIRNKETSAFASVSCYLPEQGSQSFTTSYFSFSQHVEFCSTGKCCLVVGLVCSVQCDSTIKTSTVKLQILG